MSANTLGISLNLKHYHVFSFALKEYVLMFNVCESVMQ